MSTHVPTHGPVSPLLTLALGHSYSVLIAYPTVRLRFSLPDSIEEGFSCVSVEQEFFVPLTDAVLLFHRVNVSS